MVLTRQNGALQIRLDNTYGEIKTVILEAAGLSKIYFNDGTGGRVIATGSEIQLSKSDRPSRTSDYRISINLLPVEDLTGKGRLTLTYSWGLQRVYSLRSTSGRIPIYPNQITWLVLDEACSGNADENGSGGDLSVSAGPLSAVLDLLLPGAASNEAPPVKRGRSRSEYRRMRPLVFQSVSPDYRRRGFT